MGALASAALPTPWRKHRDRGCEGGEQCEVYEGHADLKAVRHSRPVGVAQELIAHVVRRLKDANPRDVGAGIRHEARGETAQRL